MEKKLRTIQTFEQHTDGSEFQKVKAITDDSGHWYVIPNDMINEFRKDEQNEDFVDSGRFDDKYGKYQTGGDLNRIQLYDII